MTIAIWELYMGFIKGILRNDWRRLYQACHYIKRGIIICFTLGRIKPKKIDYYKEESIYAFDENDNLVEVSAKPTITREWKWK